MEEIEEKNVLEEETAEETEEAKELKEEAEKKKVETETEKTEEEKVTEEVLEKEEAEKEEKTVEEPLEEVKEERIRVKGEIPEEEIVEERIYTIPLREAWRTPRKNRAPRAIRLIRSFIQRHMKISLKTGLEEEEEEEGHLIISNEVNEWIWRRGIEKPPRKVRVRAIKDRDGNVTVYLAEGD
jgi:large subunit ribosomal protein L31e